MSVKFDDYAASVSGLDPDPQSLMRWGVLMGIHFTMGGEECIIFLEAAQTGSPDRLWIVTT